MKKKLSALFILLLVLFIFTLPWFYKIDDLACQTQFGKCDTELEERLTKLKGKSYHVIKKDIDNLMIDSPNINKYLVQIKLPKTLLIKFEIKNPVYSINQKDTQNYIFLDDRGVVLTIGQSSDLPTVTVSTKLNNTGEKVNEKYLFALRLVAGLNSMYQIKQGEIKNDSLMVEIRPPVNVIFPLEGNEKLLLGSIRIIYEKVFTSDTLDTNISEIDLRFKNPVLR